MSEHPERRLAALMDEIRNYPTPIARCDEQLTALLEERSRLVEQLRQFESEPRQTCSPLATWANDGGFHGA
jgi:hypothetical protein